VQPPLGIELVGEVEQVALVRATPVVEDEQAGGVARRRPLEVREVGHGC
jgi:hypothetical protein